MPRGTRGKLSQRTKRNQKPPKISNINASGASGTQNTSSMPSSSRFANVLGGMVGTLYLLWGILTAISGIILLSSFSRLQEDFNIEVSVSLRILVILITLAPVFGVASLILAFTIKRASLSGPVKFFIIISPVVIHFVTCQIMGMLLQDSMKEYSNETLKIHPAAARLTPNAAPKLN